LGCPVAAYVFFLFFTHVSFLQERVLAGSSDARIDQSNKPSVVLLGIFVNLETRLLASSCPCVHPSTRIEQLGPGGIFMKFDISVFFENLSIKFKFHQNLTRLTGILQENQYIFM